MIASVMCSALKETGFEIVGPTPREEEALALIASQPIDAATVDIRLDMKDSYPIADELAQRNIPFVFFSGYSRRDMPEKFKGRPFITKPLNHSQVVRAVTDLLAGA
jgi:two-component system, response regulator PdtaR